MTRTLERVYGRGPGHLAAMAVCFGFAAYAFGSIFANAAPWSVLTWMVGGILLHEFVLFPIYTTVLWLLSRVFGAEPRRPARVRLVQHVAAPVGLSALLLLTWMPLILRLSERAYEPTTGMTQEPYLGRWLALTAALLAVSAAIYAARSVRARRRAPAPEAP